MNSIGIVDSLTHPTLNSNWIKPDDLGKSNILALLKQMDENNIIKAFAVGMQGIGNYNEEQYVKFIQEASDKLIPIAFYHFSSMRSESEIEERLKVISTLGYRGIKIHPRIGELSLNHELLPFLIQSANSKKLIVQICTYFYDSKRGSNENNIISLISLLEKISDQKLILVHSGSVKLMEYHEIARVFPKILLDLSFTLCKYEGSSIDLDISHLFKYFDQRICIGSDFPEFSLFDLRRRFNHFSEGLSKQKKQNISHKNILDYYEL